MSGFEPGHHRVVIGLFNHVLVSPFVVLSFINTEWLVFGSRGVVEIIQLESIIVISAVFLNTKNFRFSKAPDLTLIGFVVEKVEWSSSELVSFQVQNCDAWDGALSLIQVKEVKPLSSGFENNGLSFIHHSKTVYRFGPDEFKKNFTIFIHMGYRVLSESKHAQENESIVEGWMEIQNLVVGLGCLYLSLVYEKHT